VKPSRGGWLLGALVPAAVAVLWEALARAGVLSEDGFSRPSRWLVAGGRALADGSLLQQTGQTFGAAAQALAIAAAAAAGISFGTLLGLSRPLERAATLTIDALRPVPSVALIPLSSSSGQSLEAELEFPLMMAAQPLCGFAGARRRSRGPSPGRSRWVPGPTQGTSCISGESPRSARL